MSRRVRWSTVEEELAELGRPALLRLIKEMFDASTENQVFLASRFANLDVRESAIEPYRKRIVDQFFPARGFGKLGLREARKAIIDYRRATQDLAGTLDLMLTYVEQGTRFTNEFGDIEESFYNSMESVLDQAAKLGLSQPDLYEQFRDRFIGLKHATSGIGWGYHDGVSEIVDELEAQIVKSSV
jgi:hypothetical protein